MKTTYWLGLALLAISLGSVTACDGCSGRGTGGKIALKPPPGSGKRPQGLRALSVAPGAQPFTQADVSAYFKTHNLPKNAAPASSIQVDALEFVRSAEVTARLQGVSTGLPDNDPVAFATLSGAFVFTGPQGAQGRFRRAYAVFDSATGNLLLIGTLPAEEHQ